MIAMTQIDQLSLALCAWKEARGGGIPGMQSVINVVLNRVKARNSSCYAEIYRPLQFSSMSYPHDPQLLKQPEKGDPQWGIAQTLAINATTGMLEDLTDGATFYYATSMDNNPPVWAKTMLPTVVIGDQRFFKEAS